jgi:L-asparaginase/Glu-tRNA(Gln) amidotransferase subunit D
VATVRDDELVALEPYEHRACERPVQQVDGRVLAVRLYPGLDFDALHSAITHGGVRGVVVELYPSATGPDTGDRFSLPAFVRRCAESEVIVAATSPGSAPEGGTAYETTLAIADAGALLLADMSVEAATVKLMWALAQSPRAQTVRRLMLTAIAGELASRLSSR